MKIIWSSPSPEPTLRSLWPRRVWLAPHHNFEKFQPGLSFWERSIAHTKWANRLKPNILTNKSLKGKPAVRVEVNDIGSWESPGATDEEAPTRETPPTHTKKAAPAKNIHAEVLSFCFADGISWNAKSTSSPSDTEEKGEKNAVNPSSVTLNPVALQCRISSMQPFNDTFSPLCPVISFTNPPKSWHWTDIQRMLLVNDTFTSECFLSLLNSVPCLSSLSQAESVCFFSSASCGDSFVYNQTKPFVFSHSSSLSIHVVG